MIAAARLLYPVKRADLQTACVVYIMRDGNVKTLFLQKAISRPHVKNAVKYLQTAARLLC